MDDEQYRQTKDSLPSPSCVFEKALHCGYFQCDHVQATQIGERQALRCRQPIKAKRCAHFYELSVDNADFAVGRVRYSSHLPSRLSFAQVMKIQVGALQGVQAMLELKVLAEVDQILNVAEREYGSLKQLDFSKIVPAISRFKLARRRPS